MKIALAGWPFVMTGFLAVIVGTILSQGFGLLLQGMLLSLMGAGFTFFCVYFFRDPDRPLPKDAGKIYSPGDGRVLSVAREGRDETVTLRIFLSIFDVHIQRVPCSGRVEKIEYRAGSFRAAMKDEARYNERSVLHIKPDGDRETLIVEQIAGLVARRIECWAKEGRRLVMGERYGLIRFGSQAVVHFPASARCIVKPGDRVAGGVTVIGEWISKP